MWVAWGLQSVSGVCRKSSFVKDFVLNLWSLKVTLGGQCQKDIAVRLVRAEREHTWTHEATVMGFFIQKADTCTSAL